MNHEQTSVLVVDDESTLRRALRTSLSASGFCVEEARNGEEAIDVFGQRTCNVVLLDINMPGAGGIETCRRLRELDAEAGIMMITVRDAEDDKVRALEAGADDFITKPYRFRELVARIRSLLRRVQAKQQPANPVLRVGDLQLDLERRVLRRGGDEVHLSPTEYDLIAYFFQHQDVPITHMKLLQSVWGPEYGGELEYLRAYIRILRKKIETDPSRPAYLLTEPWVGYRLRDPAAAANCASK
jgi:two-component system, OmpR family, KDP operon response regulator KdpE